jgi:chaperonin GroES
MKLKPLFDKVVVKELEGLDSTKSGIILPTSAQEKPSFAVVIAVGPGGFIDGEEVKMQVKVGDKILFSKYAGSEFKIENEKVIVVKQSDILAIVE